MHLFQTNDKRLQVIDQMQAQGHFLRRILPIPSSSRAPEGRLDPR